MLRHILCRVIQKTVSCFTPVSRNKDPEGGFRVLALKKAQRRIIFCASQLIIKGCVKITQFAIKSYFFMFVNTFFGKIKI